MKVQYSLRLLFAGAFIALIGACATRPSDPGALAGTWTNSLGTVWAINADGTFHVTATIPKAEIWANYTVAGDMMTIQETRRVGSAAKSCKGPACINSADRMKTRWRSFWSVTSASRG